MKILSVFTLIFLVPWAAAQDNGISTVSPLAAYPTCAQTCLQGGFTNTTFCPDPSNSTCTCNDPGFNAFVELCVKETCSLRNSLVTENVTVQLCNRPSRNRSTTLIRETSALLATTCLLIFARVLFKIFAQGQSLWWDDYLLVFLLFTGGAPNMIISIAVLAPNGVGRDFWTLSFDQITTIFKWNYIESALYFPQVAALKCVFLCFFLRIFTTRTTRHVINGTMVLTLVWGAASTFVAVFECWPIPYYWVWDGSPGGKCMDKNNVQLANAVISIALDVWILAIPLWNIRKLNMSLPKKMGIASMFMMGGLVTIVSCVRLKFLRDVVTSSNPTQTIFNITRWSTIEGNTSIYCACMPMMRQVLVRLFPCYPDTERPGRRRSAYYRIFSNKKTTGSGQRIGPHVGQGGVKGSSNSSGLPSSGDSTRGRGGFWTMALASANQDNEEVGRSANRYRTSESSAAGFGGVDGSNIIFTTTYEVDYEVVPPEMRINNIAMDSVHGRPVTPGQSPPSKSYQATVRYGK